MHACVESDQPCQGATPSVPMCMCAGPHETLAGKLSSVRALPQQGRIGGAFRIDPLEEHVRFWEADMSCSP
jgi:hypothetical protein